MCLVNYEVTIENIILLYIYIQLYQLYSLSSIIYFCFYDKILNWKLALMIPEFAHKVPSNQICAMLSKIPSWNAGNFLL